VAVTNRQHVRRLRHIAGAPRHLQLCSGVSADNCYGTVPSQHQTKFMVLIYIYFISKNIFISHLKN